MFLMEWFNGILAMLGLAMKDAKILFTCSKTRYVQRSGQHQPTQHPTSEELSIGKIRFKAFDLGGHQIARRVWKDYYAQVDAIVFLVDSVDKERFSESKAELDALLLDDLLSSVPFVILGNKMDIRGALLLLGPDQLHYWQKEGEPCRLGRPDH
ncbi:GTP-binding protein SAR1A-like protein [Cinnamomum micranthum f. kanehirae]|uniref:GTP-binding protein SAR1A-like protein n=1 Tax=Cinnamomum micranthum f. kanehirae TaxID=337451 RepID=A0A443NUQ3_9MAGN|nr:GTP-binding protein SAR1A-like protein [Cinnamomum micranthum f. kanehirae]